jgi:perosamine synthetase
MSDMMAAMGLVQLESVADELHRRQAIAGQYLRAFAGREDVRTQFVRPEVRHAWHLFPILLRLDMLRVDRDEFMRELLDRGIATSIHYRPLHLFERFAPHCRIGPRCGEASGWIYERLITLPLYSRLDPQDVAWIIESVLDLLQKHKR